MFCRHKFTSEIGIKMKIREMRFAAFACAAALTVGFCAEATHAQTWPNKPISLIVTYPAGGGADAMARLIAPKLSEALGQNVIVENKPGASGQIGASMVAKAAPDGYTLMLDASSFAVNPSLFSKLPYDSEKAFKPIGVIALFPNVLLVNANFAAKSVNDVVTMAKVKSNAVAYASSGNGSAQHLAGAMFEAAANVDMLHVPYKGGGPALIDVIGGQVPIFFGNLASTLQHVQSGKLRPLAVTSSKRSPILPEVPTIAESGVAGYEVLEWNVLFAPAGTHEPVIAQIAAALQKTLDAPDVKARIAQLGGEPQTAKPEVALQFLRQQTALWAKLVKARNITAE
jgi:tripartite-type tricarboxylate transporter receptor subunit TctC